MHKLLSCIICILFIIVGFVTGLEAGIVHVEGFNVASENTSLILYFHPETTEIAVKSKLTGDIWFSNPPNRMSEEVIARGRGRERLNAQFQITYHTPRGETRYYNNYSDSILLDQYDIFLINNGIRIDYLLGEMWDDDDYLPLVLTQETFNDIMEQVEVDFDRDFLRDSFVPISIGKADGDENFERTSVYRLDKERAFGEYAIENVEGYDRRDLVTSLVDRIVEGHQNLVGREQVRKDHITPFLGETAFVLHHDLVGWDLDDIIDILKGMGYTPEDIAWEHRQYQLHPPVPNIETFQISIEYYLEDDNLIVRIPGERIEYPFEIFDRSVQQKITYPLVNIELMKYFGAAGRDEEGYIFVPDGSGALIEFNNEKHFARPFNMPVYGRDLAVHGRLDMRDVEQIYLPVYGLKYEEHGGRGMIGIIEKGEELAHIISDIAGRDDSYNKVYPRFNVLPNTEVGLRADIARDFELPSGGGLRAMGTTQVVYQKNLYREDLQVRYVFLKGSEADYAGMARNYQDYLRKNNILGEAKTEQVIPLFIDMIGAIHKYRPVLGISREVVEPLTSFEQARHIVTLMEGAGLGNINILYSGWLSGGKQHYYPSNVDVENRLGGESDFMMFDEYLQEKGIPLIPEVGFMNIYRTRLTDGFQSRSHSSRTLSRQSLEIRKRNPLSLNPTGTERFFVLSPNYLKKTIDNFINNYSNYQQEAISLRNMGSQLYSDFRERSTIERFQAVKLIQEQLEKLRKSGYAISVRGGNAYVLPYVQNILELPIKSSQFKITDRSVPFYQLVLHGFKHHTGPPMNLASDYRDSLLKAVETGASPLFVWFYVQPSAIINSDFGYLHSSNFKDWLDEAVILYSKMEQLSDLSIERITCHKQLVDNVYQTTFENNHAIIVNYNSKSVRVGGITVDGKQFVRIEEALSP